MKRIVTIFGSLGLAAVIGISMIGGVVDAQTSTPSDTATTASTSKKDQFLGTLASKLGVTTDTLQTAIEQTADDVGFGTGRIGERLRDRVQNRRDQIIGRMDLAPAAAFIGITDDQLVTELQDDKTLIEVAREHGKTDDQIRTFLIARATTDIDEQLQTASDDTIPTRGT